MAKLLYSVSLVGRFECVSASSRPYLGSHTMRTGVSEISGDSRKNIHRRDFSTVTSVLRLNAVDRVNLETYSFMGAYYASPSLKKAE